MKIHTKEINGLLMLGYNDSGSDWVIQSVDNDAYKRTARYPQKDFTLKRAFQFHAELYVNL